MTALDKLDAKLRNPTPPPRNAAPAPRETFMFVLLSDGTVEALGDIDDRGIAWTRITGATLRDAAEALATVMGLRSNEE